MAEVAKGDRAKLVARYKAHLRECIDRRPSGLRQRLATALDKHKSFVSQITSPAYAVPIPAGDLPTIFEICHLLPDERRTFLRLYGQAHPRASPKPTAAQPQPHRIQIDLPAFSDTSTAHEVESLIRDFATRVIKLAQRQEREAQT